LLLAVVEQAGLLKLADHMARQRTRLKPASLVKLAKLRHCLLNHTTANPHAAHKTPVTMNLAVLPPCRVAQVHALITTQPGSKENGDGRHYTPIRTQHACQTLDLFHQHQQQNLKPSLKLRKLG